MNLEQELASNIEEAISDNIYEAYVVLESDRGKNLTHILNQLRAVCGITVVGVEDPARPVSATREKTLLKLKFFRSVPNLRKHLQKMSIDARKVDGVYTFFIKQVRKLKASFKGD